MAGSVASGFLDSLILDYQNGASLPEISSRYGISQSTARHHVLKAGVLRSRAEGIRMVAARGRLGAGLRGKTRQFTAEHCANISAGRSAWAEVNAAGIRLTTSGYLEYTRGPHKGRSVHVVNMEERLGRRLREDEHVHHIDGDKLNNNDNNLALVTRSGHMRLHRRESRLIKQKEQ